MNDEVQQAQKNRRDLLTAVASLATTGLIGLGTYQFSQLSGAIEGLDIEFGNLRSVLTEVQLEVAVVHQAHTIHENEANRWKDLIERLQHAVHQLETNAAARKDAFTGTQGAMHEAWINANKREIQILKSLIKAIESCVDNAKAKSKIGSMQ